MSQKISKNVRLFIVAGESSGDVLGGKIIAQIKSELKLKDRKLEIHGIGGSNMENQGLKSLFDMSELSLMGFFEVVPHLPKLIKRINQTAQAIINLKPDLVITIDSPDFCFRVIKKLNEDRVVSSHIKKVHFVAPTVWAYRPGRAKKIAKLFNLLLVILPFEPPYFEKYGLKTKFIGHPITENKITIKNNNFRKKYQIDDKKTLICLTPGSRAGEIKRMLPEMIGAINILSEKYKNLSVGIAVTSKTHDLVALEVSKFKCQAVLVLEEDKIKLFDAANIALAKSGTNTLEMAMYELPMVITYKANFLTYLLLKMMVRIKFANLINLILNREVIPEMLQYDCHSAKLAAKLEDLLNNPGKQQFQIDESKAVLKMLGLGSKENPSKKAAIEALRGIAN